MCCEEGMKMSVHQADSLVGLDQCESFSGCTDFVLGTDEAILFISQCFSSGTMDMHQVINVRTIRPDEMRSSREGLLQTI